MDYTFMNIGNGYNYKEKTIHNKADTEAHIKNIASSKIFLWTNKNKFLRRSDHVLRYNFTISIVLTISFIKQIQM